MANIYKNAQFDLTSTDVTDVYTVPLMFILYHQTQEQLFKIYTWQT